MRPDASKVSSGGIGNALRLLAVALTAATVAACAQPAVVGDKPGSQGFSTRQASLEPSGKASSARSRQAAVVTKGQSATDKPTPETPDASYGLASYYGDSQTASGEKFDARELTAAHRTLPFGTRVRITNIATGRSVTVRVNDRGPFIPGRIVDVSPSAAETLGMVQQGVAKVKLDVVQ
jgi:rare lipoprotein A